MPPSKRPPAPRRQPSGYGARALAVGCLFAILERGRPLDEAFDEAASRVGTLDPRDRALARLIVLTALRNKGALETVIGSFLEKPLPKGTGRLPAILLSAAAQLLLIDTPPHAAISIAVDQCRDDFKARRFDRLTNAVLRRVSAEGREALTRLDTVKSNIPPKLYDRWVAAYGDALARDVAAASLGEAALDLSVKSDPATWAERLGGIVLPTGSVRIARAARVGDLEGFADGAWWVQDAAAALPARLFGSVAGLDVADLCAAPGGKTAQLAAAGARVTAVEKSQPRTRRLTDNLTRLALSAEIVDADVLDWEPKRTFDAVLLDAPCSATGTIRRHPDILHLTRKEDVAARATLQENLLKRAAALVSPGGLLVFCTCSLEPEEGPDVAARFLAETPDFVREPIHAGEAGFDATWLTPEGDMRTLPCHLPHAEPGFSGLDGFFAARFRRCP